MPQINPQMRQEAQQQTNQLLQLLSSLLQTAPQQQAQMEAVQGDIRANQQRMGGGGGGQSQKPQANAYQKGFDKALNESGYAHASEAIMKGADPMMVANQSSQMGVQQSQQNMAPLLQSLLSMAQQPQQQPQQQITPIQQQAQNIVKPATGPLGKVFEAAGFGSQTKQRQLGNLSKAQEIMGQQPLQQADREKNRMSVDLEEMKAIYSKNSELSKEDRKNTFDQISNIIKEPTLSGESATKKLIANQGLEAATNILSGMEEFGDSYINNLSTPNSYEGQKLAAFGNMLQEANARIPGGATLSKNELEFAKAITTPTGRRAIVTNPKFAKEMTQSLVKKFKNILKDIDPYSDNRSAYKKARQSGYSNEEIAKFWKSKGIIQ